MSEKLVKPLGQKIANAISGTTALALVLTFLLNLVPTIYYHRQEVMNRSKAQVELLSSSLVAPVDFADTDAARESLATLSLIPEVTGAAVYVDGETPFAVYGTPPGKRAVQHISLESGFTDISIASPIPASNKGGVLVVAVSLDGQWALLRSQTVIGLVVLLFVFTLCHKLAGILRCKLGDPLGELTNVVRSISQNRDFSRRVDCRTNDEVGVLVAEFNDMLRRVEKRDLRLSRHREVLQETVEERTIQLRRKQKELQANNQRLLQEMRMRAKAEMIRQEVERINRHDLKSGLSLVIGYPDLLLMEGNLNHRQEKHIRRIRAAGYRMLDMIRNQLDIFKLEKGFYSLKKSGVDLIEIICSLEEEFSPLLDGSRVEFSFLLEGREVVGDESFEVQGEVVLMRTMVRNLIQNAIEASSEGEIVTVSLTLTEGQQIVISNPGVVPEDIRKRFFDKYVTFGKENGTGLGTYFAALIARTHGADIDMATDTETGTTITVVFRDEEPEESKQSVA